VRVLPLGLVARYTLLAVCLGLVASLSSACRDGTAAVAQDILSRTHDTKRAKTGVRVDRAKLQQIDLHWRDLRHEGACRLLADGVDIRAIQLMLGHSDIKTTQRYLNITDEEVRKSLTGVWERWRQLKVVGE
jgi:site-specific recombinase XerD